MKTDELNKKALEVMKTHNVTEVYATRDGNIFLPKNKSAANFHAKNTNQKVYELKKEDILNTVEKTVQPDLNVNTQNSDNTDKNVDLNVKIENSDNTENSVEIIEETENKKSKKSNK